MKIFTINQLRYTLLLAIITIFFRYGLSAFISVEKFTEMWFLAIIYGIIVFIIAWIFGKKDKLSLRLFDIGFRFHLTTYLICNSIAELWFIFGFNASNENIKIIHLTALIWGILLLTHFVFFLVTRRYSILGIKKSEIFD